MCRTIFVARVPQITALAILVMLMAGCGNGGAVAATPAAMIVALATSVPSGPTPAPVVMAMQETLMLIPSQPPPTQAQFVDTGTQNPRGSGITYASQKRVVLKNATLNLTVDDPAASVTAITQMAEQMGGWVVTSSSAMTERDSHRLAQATISVRVPAEQFSSALQQIKAGAVSVESETITGDDVTQKYVDLTSQLSNLEATETQLQKIMSTANNVNDVLAVQQRLTEVQGQIESIKGQLKYFSEAASYSLITLVLTQKPLPQTPTPTATATPTPTITPTSTITPTPTEVPLGFANWQPGPIAQNAVSALVGAGQIAISILIWLIIGGVPLVIPAIIIVYLYRRVRRRPIPAQPQVGSD
jgi:hypothetical protein